MVAFLTFASSEPWGSTFLKMCAIGSVINISYHTPMPMGVPSSELTGMLRMYF